MDYTKLKPAVPKRWLMLVAGLLWSVVGLALCRVAYKWFMTVGTLPGLFMAIGAVLLSVVVARFGFSRIAQNNIDRLRLLSDRSCLFAFQAWKSYLIIAIMITMGFILRHSPVPRQYLAVIYMTIGGALFLSSFHYYRTAWRSLGLKSPFRLFRKNR